ncbi:hypothetical protein [Bowmanella dokdonensis]|uniref:Uncharacterized protein n=1 Tax=Bowmanella dokdonensis TaxID=751969 RepID=A0A939DL89_9ALTE|nr:hypothetical protein [Bowmanella dokdonensis]MBN7824793.1 hypothetical protein [Bowmanella dokdonensis]
MSMVRHSAWNLEILARFKDGETLLQVTPADATEAIFSVFSSSGKLLVKKMMSTGGIVASGNKFRVELTHEDMSFAGQVDRQFMVLVDGKEYRKTIDSVNVAESRRTIEE